MWALLRRAREAGVSVAFAELFAGLRAGREQEPEQVFGGATELDSLLAELSRPTDVCGIPRRVDLCRRALALVDRAENERLWAAAQGELGNSLVQTPRGDRAENLEEAISCYQAALEVFEPRTLPDDCRRTAANLGRLCFEQGRWAEAVQACQTAQQAADLLYQAAVSRGGREAELAAAGDVAHWAAYSLARLNRGQEAVLCLERARARGFSDALARDQAELAGVERLEPQAARAFRQAADRLRQWDREQLASGAEHAGGEGPAESLTARQREAEAAQQALQSAVARIRQLPGHAHFLATASAGDIAEAAGQATLVYLVTASQGSRAWIVNGSDQPDQFQVETVEADEFNRAELDQLLLKRQEDEVTGGYLLPAQLALPEHLDRELEGLLPVLGRKLIGPVARRLGELDPRPVILVPCGHLGLLPLHAGPYGTNGGQGRCLLDEPYPVSYTPNARLYHGAARHTGSHRAPPRVVAVGNPLPDRSTVAAARAQLLELLPDLRAAVHLAASAVTNGPAAAVRTVGRGGWRSMADWLDRLPETSLQDLTESGAAVSALASLAPLLSEPAGETLRELAARMPSSLRWAEAEVESLMELLPPDSGRAFYRQQATRDALLQSLPWANTAHLSCHGVFQASDPLASRVHLCGEDLLLREIVRGEIEGLRGIRLMVLSACQTAIQDFEQLPDEAIGLPAGLMHAGVGGVLATLWPVDDLSTAMVMVKFYEAYMQPGISPAEALGMAQRWLRDSTNAQFLEFFKQHRELNKARPQAPLRMPNTFIREGVAQFSAEASSQRPYADRPSHWAPFVFVGA